ncbi:MAG: alpha/beta fold hydrolase [Myxococcota bacterium]
MLALHGYTGGCRDMEALAEHLQRPVVGLDLPGHGGTAADPDGAGPSFAQVIAELADLCGPAGSVSETLRGLGAGGPPVLFGYSMGGRLALALALTAPERFSALVLVGATAGLADADARAARRLADAQLAARVESIGAAAFAAEWAQHPLIRSQRRAPQPHRDAMAARRAANDARGLAASLRGCGVGQMTPLHGALPSLALPVLLLTGAEDTRYAAEAAAMCALLPDARHVPIAHAGHAAHLEAPASTAEAIERFLRPAL